MTTQHRGHISGCTRKRASLKSAQGNQVFIGSKYSSGAWRFRDRLGTQVALQDMEVRAENKLSKMQSSCLAGATHGNLPLSVSFPSSLCVSVYLSQSLPSCHSWAFCPPLRHSLSLSLSLSFPFSSSLLSSLCLLHLLATDWLPLLSLGFCSS